MAVTVGPTRPEQTRAAVKELLTELHRAPQALEPLHTDPEGSALSCACAEGKWHCARAPARLQSAFLGFEHVRVELNSTGSVADSYENGGNRGNWNSHGRDYEDNHLWGVNQRPRRIVRQSSGFHKKMQNVPKLNQYVDQTYMFEIWGGSRDYVSNKEVIVLQLNEWMNDWMNEWMNK
jgi:hypothetical protein